MLDKQTRDLLKHCLLEYGRRLSPMPVPSNIVEIQDKHSDFLKHTL